MFKALSAILLACSSLRAATVSINAGLPFNPSSVTVTVGDTIHIDFLGGFHNAAETNNSLPGSAVYNGTGFRSGNPGAAATYDFVPSPGGHKYFCEIHGGFSMYGYIFVYASPTPSLTVTVSPTISPTFTISDTFTPGPSPTITVTPSLTPTPSPSLTVSPVYAKAPGRQALLGPVPMKAGGQLCLYFAKMPFRTRCQLFNSKGELVANGSFATELAQCLETQKLGAGLYFAEIDEEDTVQKHAVRRQKIVVLP